MSKPRVVVAMSGGVDSAVAAGLLVQQGYDVVGLTMRLWTQEDPNAPRLHRRCCPAEDMDDARTAAGLLGVPHYVLNMEEAFSAHVVDYFVSEYGRGRTPNPCLPCNEHVKFRALMAHAEAMDAAYLATGHYARIEGENGAYRLLSAADGEKDQSYVLYMLGQRELGRLLFPLGGLRKERVRGLAAEMGLPLAEKPDSADICFLPTEDYRDFIAERVPQRLGDVVDATGNVVGRHAGVAGFTIGQRRGLGVAVGEKRFVTAIDPQLNVITVGGEDELLAHTLTVEDVRWVAGPPPADDIVADVRIRYRSAPGRARVRVTGEGACVRFERPQRAIAAGQAAVFYHGDDVLGGGIIAATG